MVGNKNLFTMSLKSNDGWNKNYPKVLVVLLVGF